MNTAYSREFIESAYKNFVEKDWNYTLVGFTFNERQGRIAPTNMRDLKDSVRRWISEKVYHQGKLVVMTIDPENNQTHKDDDGREWHSFTMMSNIDEKNPFGVFGIMKFGWLCSGWTYYFESKELRDAVVNCIQNKKLLDGTVVCAGSDINNFFHVCMDDLRDRVGEYIEEYFHKRGTPSIITTKFALEQFQVLQFAMRIEMASLICHHCESVEDYVMRRIRRHFTVRSITSPRDINLTTMSMMSESLEDEIGELRVRFDKICDDSDKADAEEQVRKEREVAEAFAVEEKAKAEAKRTKKADTRDANKARDAKKKQREDFEKASAEAMRQRLIQEQKKKQQKAQKKAQAKK